MQIATWNMEAEAIARLPLDHPVRIKARDLKLQQRDEERARRNELSRYRCPCNLCGGRRRPYKTSTVARHMRHRGRHGALRGWTEVISNLLHRAGACWESLVHMWLLFCKICLGCTDYILSHCIPQKTVGRFIVKKMCRRLSWIFIVDTIGT